jgi:hypothetical protein
MLSYENAALYHLAIIHAVECEEAFGCVWVMPVENFLCRASLDGLVLIFTYGRPPFSTGNA